MEEEIDKPIMKQKHSKLGIASFVTSIISGLSIFLLIVIAGVMETSREGGVDENSAEAVVLGLFIIFFFGTSFVALGLGVAGIFQKKCKMIFSILGTIFSALIIFGTIGIMVLGALVG